MIYVAVCALIVAGVVAFSSAGLTRSLVRQHGRERDLMLDRIMHLAGRTWTPPPAEEWQPEQPDEQERYVGSVSDLTEDY